jgi:hypothetical protein
MSRSETLSFLLQLGAFLAAAYAIIVYYRQLTAMRGQLAEAEKARQVNFALEQFDRLNSTDFMNARKEIFAQAKEHPTSEEIDLSTEVLQFINYMNHIGYIVGNGFLPLYPTIEMFYITTLRTWYCLGGQIVRVRRRKGVYMSHLQWLTERSYEYWINYRNNTDINIIAGGGSVIPVSRKAIKDSLESIQAESPSLQYRIKPQSKASLERRM